MKIFQKGFNYSQDGKGNRLVLHLQGCNMRCPWCSNPEGMAVDNDCGDYSINELVEEAVSCIPMFFDGGGVTITGGELGTQFESVLHYLKRLHNNKINTAIETNGTHASLPELFPYTDEVIIDFKHPDNEKHKAFTGVGNEQIKLNITQASRLCADLLIRIPLIHGFNDDTETMKSACEFLSDAGIKRVEILPYHEYGRVKWEKLGLIYKVSDGFVSPDTIQTMKDLLSEHNILNINT